YDMGVNQQLLPGLTLGAEAYYRTDNHLLDEGQFGQALVISPFNYQSGQIFGVEATASYTRDAFSGYANFAYSKALGHKVTSAQFNFDPAELAFINTHFVHLDHDQTYTSSVGAAYRYRGFLFTATIIAASGLRSGFANTSHLPYYVQADLGIERAIPVPYFGEVRLRGAVVNVADMVYQIRNGTGIGVFNSQFGPRRAFYAGINIPLPFLGAPQPATARVGSRGGARSPRCVPATADGGALGAAAVRRVRPGPAAPPPPLARLPPRLIDDLRCSHRRHRPVRWLAGGQGRSEDRRRHL